MLLSAALAIVIPFQLVLLSYAILGPAHYLTEISWLNSRRFFSVKKYDILLILGVAAICFAFKLPLANLLFYTFGLSFILLITKDTIRRVLAFVLLIFAGYFLLNNNLLRTIFGLYIPTLIHIYFFTGAFLLYGALKEKRFSGYLALLMFVICPVLLCVLFTGYRPEISKWTITGYRDFANINSTTLRHPGMNVYTDAVSIILTRIIAFAYTYHYINWFSKTRIIKWHQISLARFVVIGILWAASVALYCYSYRQGIRWLFMLSLAHVILEFPLNHRSFIGIGKQIGIRLKGTKA